MANFLVLVDLPWIVTGSELAFKRDGSWYVKMENEDNGRFDLRARYRIYL